MCKTECSCNTDGKIIQFTLYHLTFALSFFFFNDTVIQLFCTAIQLLKFFHCFGNLWLRSLSIIRQCNQKRGQCLGPSVKRHLTHELQRSIIKDRLLSLQLGDKIKPFSGWCSRILCHVTLPPGFPEYFSPSMQRKYSTTQK